MKSKHNKLRKKIAIVHRRIRNPFRIDESRWKIPLVALCVCAIALLVGMVRLLEDESSRIAVIPAVFRPKPSPLEIEVRDMTKGYPIEEMAPYIAREDPQVAAFLVSIAKKESNWGKRVPVLYGRDCYNYWGYRGKSKEMGTGGHTCFRNRKEAVRTVAKRIDTLVNEKKLDTPSEMIVWKCGYDCSGHSEQSVRKWVSDVAFYFKKFKGDR